MAFTPISATTGAFVPTTNIWDVDQIQSIDVNSPEFKELLIRLYQNINNMALVLNVKETAYYDLNQYLSGQLFFPNPSLSSQTSQRAVYRPGFRVTVNFGALPNTGTKSVAHNIPFNPSYTLTHIYAAASDTTGLNYIPIPYSSPTLANNIEINADSTNVNIITGSNRSNFNVCYVVLEFINQ